jgi:hypothetical protein
MAQQFILQHQVSLHRVTQDNNKMFKNSSVTFDGTPIEPGVHHGQRPVGGLYLAPGSRLDGGVVHGGQARGWELQMFEDA